MKNGNITRALHDDYIVRICVMDISHSFKASSIFMFIETLNMLSVTLGNVQDVMTVSSFLASYTW